MTKENLKKDLAALGIMPGMKLIVHSSMKSMGTVEGGAESVINALEELITPAGTLIMPSFNHSRIYRSGGIFDVSTTPTINGLIPETFRKCPGVLRSENPTHAFAAWGADAQSYTAEHQSRSSLGKGSPIYQLMEEGGYCLLLGVGYDVNTFHHCVELCEGVKCLRDVGERFPMRYADGIVRESVTWSWRGGVCPVLDNGSYAPAMAAVERRGRVLDADSRLYKLKDAYPIIAAALRGENGCRGCCIEPRVSEWTISLP